MSLLLPAASFLSFDLAVSSLPFLLPILGPAYLRLSLSPSMQLQGQYTCAYVASKSVAKVWHCRAIWQVVGSYPIPGTSVFLFCRLDIAQRVVVLDILLKALPHALPRLQRRQPQLLRDVLQITRSCFSEAYLETCLGAEAERTNVSEVKPSLHKHAYCIGLYTAWQTSYRRLRH